MNDKIKRMLIDAGMQEHIDIYEVTLLGYAGIMPGTGAIVDRRKHPEAMPVPENRYLGIPAPKEIQE